MQKKWVSALYFIFVALLIVFSSGFATSDYKGNENLFSQRSYYLFVGTYAQAENKGIFVYRLQEPSGKLTAISSVSGIKNPSYISLSFPKASSSFVYAVSETENKEPGQIYSYAFDVHSGMLHYLNKQFSQGDAPCNLSMDKTGKWLMVANYSGGSFAILPILQDGKIGSAVQTIKHTGQGIDSKRQEKPHVHCVLPSPNNHDVFVADLGLDKVFSYQLDVKNGHLMPGTPPFVNVIPGSGPRVMEFAPNGKYLYLIQEMGGKITVFEYQNRQLIVKQVIATVPEKYTKKIWAADLHLSPDGRFLYASNRDDLNDLAIFRVDPKSGILKFMQRIAVGKNPRSFLITPDGQFLLVANQDSDNIIIFKRDISSGRLYLLPYKISVQKPTNLKVLPAT